MRVVCPKASRPKSPWRSNVCLAPCERTKSNSAKASITYRKKRTCISRRPARFTRLWPNCRESSNRLHLVCRIGRHRSRPVRLSPDDCGYRHSTQPRGLSSFSGPIRRPGLCPRFRRGDELLPRCRNGCSNRRDYHAQGLAPAPGSPKITTQKPATRENALSRRTASSNFRRRSSPQGAVASISICVSLGRRLRRRPELVSATL